MKKYLFASFVAVLLLGSSQIARADITSGLMDQWKFDDGSGATAADSAGANTITFTNGASWGAPKIGASAVTLNGSSQYAVLPGSAFSTYPTSGSTNTFDKTFSTWFKTTTAGVILGQDAAVLPPSSVGAYVPAIYIDTAGKVRASMFWHGSATYQIISAASYNDGNWHHLADTYTGGVETLYIDGASVGSQTRGESGYSATYTYFLGTGYTNAWASTNNGWQYFNGSLDDTRVYSRALTSSDVTELYNYTGLVQGGGNSGAQSGGTALSGWAWSSTIGWISFNSNDANTGNGGNGKSSVAYSVAIATTTANSSDGRFSGYAWSPNIGWISFNPSDLSGCVKGDGTAVDTNADQMKADLSTGNVTGWIRAIAGVGRTDGWDGCIEISGTNHPTGDITGNSGVTYHVETVNGAQSGIFKGFSWGGAVVGWLNFSPTLAASSTTVVTCVTGCCPTDVNYPNCGGGTQSSVALTASQGTNVNVKSLSVPANSVTTLNWTISNLTNCSTSGTGSDWSKVSGTASIAANTTGSGNITFGTADVGNHQLAITCDVPASAPVAHRNDQVVITVTSGTTNPPTGPTCSTPSHSSLCSGSDQNGTTANTFNSCPTTVGSCQFVCDTANGFSAHNNTCTKSSEHEF